MLITQYIGKFVPQDKHVQLQRDFIEVHHDEYVLLFA